MLECRLSVVMGTGRKRNATNQRLSPLQLHLRQRIALHLHDLYVMGELHARTEYATVVVVQEGVHLLRVVDEAHRAIYGRVAKVVADTGHQKVFRESPDMLSWAKKRQGHQRGTFAGEAMLLRCGPNIPANTIF